MKFNLDAVHQSKKPLYTKIYDKLYKLIMDGTFPPESRLPSEPDLAKMFGVSRMTLRQALALLQDDGLIKNIHGKGNFIMKTHCNRQAIGLEKVGNPVYKCCTEEITAIELNFRIEMASDYALEVLQRETAAVVYCDRWYKSGNNVIGYALSMLPIEAVTELQIDLQDNTQLKNMLEQKIYDYANSSTITIKHSVAGNSTTQKYNLFKGEQCDLFIESVYISDKYPAMYSKYYIPTVFSQIQINASK
ncbi:GntR family transcriptional regulator [Virgibacillus sp. LDC-1]|uniref:GntR family transcriptional regulator n=1 Tax=Virgibacillus sp. LDC-1 TaxID=3039856 RepID=UPI0024DE0FDA|nr:GntR family transcriptional regulator [Virgibacillus sp. LDC-1]